MAANSEPTAKKPRGPGKRFEKGVSGNPSGRPARTPEELDLIAACKDKTKDALEVIETIMRGGQSERTKLAAALAIIERGHGKAVQPTTLNGTLAVKSAKDLTDDELAAIAAGGGAGTIGASES